MYKKYNNKEVLIFYGLPSPFPMFLNNIYNNYHYQH